MAQPASGSEKCNDTNNMNGLQNKLHDNQCDLLFPGFLINIKNDFEDHTPITKIPCGPVVNYTNSAKSNAESSSTATTKTPPAEPSVSPEVQSNFCHSVLVSGAAPSTCYGAGHVLSGVTDRRKCKARGILSVGKTGQEMVTKSKPSLIPFPPVEASVSWNLSPSSVDKDVVATVNHEPVISLEERLSSFDFNECSPFSAGSLGSENIMQTPNSDSSLERHASLPWLKEGIQLKHQFESELDQVTYTVQHESLSPCDNSSPWDPPRLSFELSDSSSPSDLTNLNCLRENSGIHESCISNSTSENVSVSVSMSKMRVSWKDALISSICDKEDLDCCRLLSDEEVDADEVLKSSNFIDHEERVDGRVKETSPVRVNPCAESICTDGGGLIASGDSDWTIYYKNRSFEF